MIYYFRNLRRRTCDPFSTFPAHLHLQIHMPTSSLSSYLAASAKSAVTLFRQIVTLKGITMPISYNVYGPFGKHLGRPKIAHESHSDVRRLCWHTGAIFVLMAELGLRKPLAETPKGSVCWEKKVAPSRFRCGEAIAVNRGEQR